MDNNNKVIEIFWKDLSELGQNKIIDNKLHTQEIIKNQTPVILLIK